MPHSVQAKKRVRQSEKRRINRKSARNEIKSLTKSFEEKVKAKDLEAAKTLFQKVVSKLDKAAKNHVYHKNAVARRKSKAAGIFNQLAPAAPAAKA
jgi:small subunit ribosomal protein S20